jgi:prepilin-type N-terminal cleavage/methylation domain-containing protein
MIGMSFSKLQSRTAGFTLLEMLVVMAIAGILLAVMGVAYQSNLKNSKSADFIEALAQDINLARSNAMAKGQNTQVDFVSVSSYKVSLVDGSGALIAPPLVPLKTDTTVTMSGFTAGDKLVCTSRGFCTAYSSANALKTINQISCTANGKTRVMSITVLGLTRLES